MGAAAWNTGRKLSQPAALDCIKKKWIATQERPALVSGAGRHITASAKSSMSHTHLNAWCKVEDPLASLTTQRHLWCKCSQTWYSFTLKSGWTDLTGPKLRLGSCSLLIRSVRVCVVLGVYLWGSFSVHNFFIQYILLFVEVLSWAELLNHPSQPNFFLSFILRTWQAHVGFTQNLPEVHSLLHRKHERKKERKEKRGSQNGHCEAYILSAASSSSRNADPLFHPLQALTFVHLCKSQLAATWQIFK